MHFLHHVFLKDFSPQAMRATGACQFLMLRCDDGLCCLFFPVEIQHIDALEIFKNGGKVYQPIAGGICERLDRGTPRTFFQSNGLKELFGFDSPPDAADRWMLLSSIHQTLEGLLSESLC